MKMKFLAAAFVLSVAAVCAGCVKYDSNGMENRKSGICVQTSSAVLKSLGMDETSLKAKSFYLLIDCAGDASDYFVKMIWNGSKWLPESDILMEASPEELSSANISALFYESSTALTRESFETAAEYFLSAAEGFYPDILYASTVPGGSLATGTIDVNVTTITICFAHPMSRLRFVSGEGVRLDKIEAGGISRNFVWNAALNDGYEQGAPDGIISVDMPENDAPELYIAPQTVQEFTLEFTWYDLSEKKSYKTVYTYGGTVFETGKSYTISLPSSAIQKKAAVIIEE